MKSLSEKQMTLDWFDQRLYFEKHYLGNETYQEFIDGSNYLESIGRPYG